MRPRPQGWGASQPPALSSSRMKWTLCSLEKLQTGFSCCFRKNRKNCGPGSCQLPAGSRDEVGSFSLLSLSVCLQHPFLMEPIGPCLTKQAVKDVFRSMVHGKGLWAQAKPSSLASLYSASIHTFLTHLSFYITRQIRQKPKFPLLPDTM